MARWHQEKRVGGLTVMMRVILAFALREVITRFGRNRLGVLWALAEPTIYILGFAVLRSQLGDMSVFGDNILIFVISGLLAFRMFMNIATRGIGALTTNTALLTYPLVRPIDVILGRLLLEALTMLTVFVIFFAGIIISSEQRVIFHPQQVVAAMVSILLLSVGVGVFNAVFSAINRTWERIWRVARLPILLLSGVFYLPSSLPLVLQEILYLNPLMHGIEWLRSGIYLTYTPLTLNPFYLLSFGTVMLALGLLLERIYRGRILSL